MNPNDLVDRWRIAVAIGSLVVLVALVIGFSGRDLISKPTPINGDVLGAESAESTQDYVLRAQHSLQQQLDDDPQALGYALVTFNSPLTAQEAGQLLEKQQRVNALMVSEKPVLALPEPIAGVTRGETFTQQLDMHNLPDAKIQAVVVRGRYVDVEKLVANDAVLAVEVLPPDAVWLQFSVRSGGGADRKYTAPLPAK